MKINSFFILIWPLRSRNTFDKKNICASQCLAKNSRASQELANTIDFYNNGCSRPIHPLLSFATSRQRSIWSSLSQQKQSCICHLLRYLFSFSIFLHTLCELLFHLRRHWLMRRIFRAAFNSVSQLQSSSLLFCSIYLRLSGICTPTSRTDVLTLVPKCTAISLVCFILFLSRIPLVY